MPNVHELIRHHVTLSIRCLDRLYLHAYGPPCCLSTTSSRAPFAPRSITSIPRSAKSTRRPPLPRKKLASTLTMFPLESV